MATRSGHSGVYALQVVEKERDHALDIAPTLYRLMVVLGVTGIRWERVMRANSARLKNVP